MSHPISAYSPCINQIGTALHEIGHALGLRHEHQQPDRDEYVVIRRENIRKVGGAGYADPFAKVTHMNSYGIPYDMSSVMHYDQAVSIKSGRWAVLATPTHLLKSHI